MQEEKSCMFFYLSILARYIGLKTQKWLYTSNIVRFLTNAKQYYYFVQKTFNENHCCIQLCLIM